MSLAPIENYPRATDWQNACKGSGTPSANNLARKNLYERRDDTNDTMEGGFQTSKDTDRHCCWLSLTFQKAHMVYHTVCHLVYPIVYHIWFTRL